MCMYKDGCFGYRLHEDGIRNPYVVWVDEYLRRTIRDEFFATKIYLGTYKYLLGKYLLVTGG